MKQIKKMFMNDEFSKLEEDSCGIFQNTTLEKSGGKKKRRKKHTHTKPVTSGHMARLELGTS
jgi:hypothetical protein